MARKKAEKIICAYCGREIVKRRYNQIYCCWKCGDNARRYGEIIPMEQRAERAKPKKKVEPKPKDEKPKYKSELARLNAEARAHGMTYGQYVSKFGL